LKKPEQGLKTKNSRRSLKFMTRLLTLSVEIASKLLGEKLKQQENRKN